MVSTLLSCTADLRDHNVPVAAGNDRRVGALRVGKGEEALGLVDRGSVRAGGEEVGGQFGTVWAADALDPDAG